MLVSRLRRRVRLLRREAEARRAAAAAALPPAPEALFDWTRRFLAPILTNEPSPFHHWLAGELDAISVRRGARLNVLAPRGSAKSSWASFAYPLREALAGREPFTVIVSDTSGQAEAFLRQIRAQLEENDGIREAYPRGFGRGPVWRDNHVRLRNGCEILAMGTGGKIRGRKSTANRRPSLLICDDLQNKDHILSRLQRERSWEWFTKDLLSAGEPGTNVVVLGTALHRDCVSCRLGRSSGWESRTWRAVVEWPERMDLWRVWEGILNDWEDPDREATARRFYEDNRAEMDA